MTVLLKGKKNLHNYFMILKQFSIHKISLPAYEHPSNTEYYNPTAWYTT